MKNTRITGRMDDGTAFVHSKTGREGTGYFTTQKRLPEIVAKLADFEDRDEPTKPIESGESRIELNEDKQVGNVKTSTMRNLCPRCGAILYRVDSVEIFSAEGYSCIETPEGTKGNFCYECGQALKWEEKK